MKGNKKKRALLCIAILLFAFNFIAVQNVSADPTIAITDNSGFSVYPGSGTPIDPYRIENFTISAALAHGISVQDTDAYFVIKNCTVYNGGWSYYGIYLENVTHGRIENCTVYNNTYGIYLYSSSNNTLTVNTAYNNTAGIGLSSTSSNNTLTVNTAFNNTAGIGLSMSCSNNTLTGNTAYNNIYGIVLSTSCSNNTLTSNTAFNNTYGIDLSTSSNNPLTSNTAYNNTAGIYLSSSSSNNTLTSNTAFNNTYGIVLFSSSSNNTLTGNTACNNTNYGIYLQSSSNNTLTGNTAFNNTAGIWLSMSCSNNTLTDTYAHNRIWDFYSDGTCADNIAYNFHILCYPTNISFTYGNGIALVGVPIGSAPPDLLNQTSLSIYVNATNVTATSWILLNISYADSNVAGLNESSLRLYRWNGTGWDLADGSGVNGVNTLNNYIYANLTQFSIFGSFGEPQPVSQLKPVGGFVLPAGAPSYVAMLIIVAIAAGAATALFAKRKLQT